jgi:tetratricopeptide (TPR) repeat protein
MKTISPPAPVEIPDAEILAHVVGELEPQVGRSARILVYALSDVRRWLASATGRKAGRIILASAEEEAEPLEPIPGLEDVLAAIYHLVRTEDSDRDVPEAIAFGCAQIVEWAESRGAHIAALLFAQAACEAFPANPHHAYEIGRLARRLADYGAAEAWLKWAACVARRRQNWDVYVLSLAGLGNLCRQRGNLPLAVRYHGLGLRVARRRSLRTLEGDELYDLAIMHYEMGHPLQATEYARGALDAYGPGHERIPRMMHDLAWIWMELVGDFRSAVDACEVLLPHTWQPESRVLVLANLARAAAGAGYERLFEASWNETWALVRKQDTREGHAAALLQLAHGAATSSRRSRVEIAAAEALSIARERQEGFSVILAERMLGVVRAPVISEDRLHRVFPDHGRTEAAVVQDEVASDLVARCANAMRVRRDGAPESPIRALIAGLA